MVILEKIKRVGDIVCVDCYAEGKEYFYLEINVVSFEVIANSMNEMNFYVFHVVQKIKEFVNSGEDLPSSAMSAWY